MNNILNSHLIMFKIIILLNYIYPNIVDDNITWDCYSNDNISYNDNHQPQNNRELEKAVIRAKIFEIHRSDGLFEMNENAIEDGFQELINVFKALNILVELVETENLLSDSLYYFSEHGRPFELMQMHSVDSLINFYYLPNIDYTDGPLNGYGQAFNTPGNELFIAGNESMYAGNELLIYDLANTFIPIHELGHCFGLLHPHSITYGIENVIREDDIADSCEVNCEFSGDKLCDTEASNSLKNDVYYDGYNCLYELIELDTCGYTYEPQINNFMGYTHFECATTFTPGQIDKMFNIIENNNVISQTMINLGDMNDDSVMNIQDILILINIVLSIQDISDLHLWLGDINNDITINILDIILLANIILE